MSTERVFAEGEAVRTLLGAQSISTLRDADLVTVLDRIGALRRALDAVSVEASGEVSARGIALGLGYRTAADAVAEHTRVTREEARAWCRVGAAITPGISLAGQVLAPERPVIGEALRAGELALGDASVILRTIEQVAARADAATLDRVEASLVASAPDCSRRDLAILARRMIDHLDPDGAEPREDLVRARSGVRVYRTPDGLETWVLKMHPEAAGFMTTAVDARTAPRRLPTFTLDGTPTDDDRRPLSERRLDALVEMARESLQRDTGSVAGAPVTLLVTIGLDALLSSVGAAQIAGVDEPISAATARRLASDAEIIPIVLGGPSEPLDEGRACRLFTAAQRRAMAVRDGGCVWPGCNAPPGWCEAAHLRSWLEGGPTDLSNGVLFCAFHHRRFDHDGWQFEWRGATLWFIPPAHADATRSPRRAGRLPAVA